MAETIHLTVQEQGQQVPMTVEEARIIEAISPEASVERVEGGVRFTVTDYEGTTSEVILDGEKGDPGDPGDKGDPGDPGQPGVSPTVTVTDIIGGHRITVTDATGPHSFDVMDGATPTVPVTDVQIDGTSILSQGVANVPRAGQSAYGVTKGYGLRGIGIVDSGANEGSVYIIPASNAEVRGGTHSYNPIVPASMDRAAFFGLAKAANADMASLSSVTVGQYPEAQRSAISQMLDAPETVSGTTPSITGKSGIRYVCGECATLTIVAPASGCIDVTFTSGSTATVLTVSSAKTGVTAIKWANGFDPTSLETNTTYEVNILDGEFGVVGSWT